MKKSIEMGILFLGFLLYNFKYYDKKNEKHKKYFIQKIEKI